MVLRLPIEVIGRDKVPNIDILNEAKIKSQVATNVINNNKIA